jgi:hypothetical protein
MTGTAALSDGRPSTGIVTEGDARYALDLVTRICRDVGPGLPATPQERRRAEIVRGELERYLGRDNVVVEDFTFAPAACLSASPSAPASRTD